MERWIGLWVVVLLLVGCAGNRGPRSASRIAKIPPAQEIKGTLWSERGHYREGEQVKLRLTLENLSDEEIILTSEEGPVLDIVFLNQGWRWSVDGPGQGQRWDRLVLAPGESFSIDWWLGPPKKSTSYLVDGIWAVPNGRTAIPFCYGTVNGNCDYIK